MGRLKQKITPHLWFDDVAEEAMNWYTSTFKNARVLSINRYNVDAPGSPGDVLTAVFQLEGQEFLALNGGPHFRFTPALSFFVSCDSEDEVEAIFQGLSTGGSILMPLQAYPFSEKFAWFEDKYGVSWQVNLGSRPQKISPFFLFAGEQHGKAEEAINLYTSLFENSRILSLERFAPGEEGTAGTVRHAVFSLHGQEFMAIDSNFEHLFTFNEALSLYVDCETQAEVDELWEKLSAGGEVQQCGWLKDRYGLAWQIVPSALPELLNDSDPARSQRVMEAMLQMVKIDVAGLQEAAEG
jgi:predicted 3-demethylubiquinone-9 3-methyltransferase (glyoxalase superfamily)